MEEDDQDLSKAKRAWLVTINYDDGETRDDFREKDYETYNGLKTTAHKCICDEVGEQGTHHTHMALYFKNATKFQALKKKFPCANLKQVKCPGYAIDYVEGNCPKKKYQLNPTFSEEGERPKQGKRNDIDQVKEIMMKGGKMRDVVPIARSVQSVRMAEIHLKYFERKRTWKPTVKWYWGDTGTGKSHAAHQELPDAYQAMKTAKWWEGYDAHEDVIIDDFRASFCEFVEMLKLLDKYPYMIECKGGSRQFLAKNIVITSCHHPRDVYHTHENVEQLLRRIDVIKKFDVVYKCEES